jgi:hypothetical protein
MQNTYWHKVLTYYERNNYFSNGLTIPFLIGTRKFIEPNNNSIQTISEFIDELLNSTHFTTIMKCGNIGEYVIGVLDNETKGLINTQYKGVYKQFGNLIVTDSSLNNITNNNELKLLFENLYSDLLDKNFFSKENGEWINYTGLDESRLTKLSTIEQ